MKKITKVLLGFFCLLFLTTSAYAEKVLLRMELQGEKAPMSLLQGGLDIASYRPGEYIDFVIDEEDMSVFRKWGFPLNIKEGNYSRLNQEMGLYHSYDETVTLLMEFQDLYPSIATVYEIGLSIEGRTIYALKISDNVDVDEDENEFYFDGCHHAREWISVEVPLFLATHLLENYGSSPSISRLVNSSAIWIVPIVNPDGYVYSDTVDSYWRKNRRNNGSSYGVDLNRNYDGAQNGDPQGDWGGAGASHSANSETYCGTEAFSEPETQAVRDLFLTHNFLAGITYHSYGEYVMWPWGYDSDVITVDNARFVNLGRAMAAIITQQDGSGHYLAQQASELYPTTGSTDDWGYGVRSPLLYTVELGQSFAPPESRIEQICQENLKAALLLMENASGFPKPPLGKLYESQNSPLFIPDGSFDGISSSIHVPDTGTIKKLNVMIDVQHSYIGDLIIELQSPASKKAILHNRGGGPVDNISTWYDKITVPVEDLDVFNESEGQGVWTLTVRDMMDYDVGTLNTWKLEIIRQEDF